MRKDIIRYEPTKGHMDIFDSDKNEYTFKLCHVTNDMVKYQLYKIQYLPKSKVWASLWTLVKIKKESKIQTIIQTNPGVNIIIYH